jgi:hypothetical protein
MEGAYSDAVNNPGTITVASVANRRFMANLAKLHWQGLNRLPVRHETWAY